jgi:AcrR family transcriptional regulator
VLNAATQVLTEEGCSRFSAARVAARAGVSRGALERYFPTKNALLVAVTEHVLDRAVNEARLLAARGPRRSDPINRFLLDSEHFFFSPVYRSMIELAIAAASDDELAEPHNALVLRGRRELNNIWLDALVDAGFARRDAELFVELTHYFLRGLFLASAWLPYKPNRRALLQAWSELAPGLLRAGQTPDSTPTTTIHARTSARQRLRRKKKA